MSRQTAHRQGCGGERSGQGLSAGADLATFQGQPEDDLRTAADQGMMAEALESMQRSALRRFMDGVLAAAWCWLPLVT